MPKRHPDRYLIQSWPNGNGFVIYLDRRTAPKWVLNKGMLRSPCDIAGCNEWVPKGIGTSDIHFTVLSALRVLTIWATTPRASQEP